MVLLIHAKGKKIVRVLKAGHKQSIESLDCTTALWELAERFPEDIIGWCEEEVYEDVDQGKWNDIFHHDLIMASYAVKCTFLSDSIGYVDQLPFVNVNREVQYPTWQMSSDTGGIYGKVLTRFKPLFGDISDLDYLLNSIAKTGQQNGLFCYSDPALTKAAANRNPVPLASYRELFAFVRQHYTGSWTSVLLWCLWKYEQKVPFMELFYGFVSRKRISGRRSILADLNSSPKFTKPDQHLDRCDYSHIGTSKTYLEQVLEDLKGQSLNLNMVLLLKQDPDQNADSQLIGIIK